MVARIGPMGLSSRNREVGQTPPAVRSKRKLVQGRRYRACRQSVPSGWPSQAVVGRAAQYPGGEQHAPGRQISTQPSERTSTGDDRARWGERGGGGVDTICRAVLPTLLLGTELQKRIDSMRTFRTATGYDTARNATEFVQQPFRAGFAVSSSRGGRHRRSFTEQA